jgi:serine/threonine protein kinase
VSNAQDDKIEQQPGPHPVEPEIASESSPADDRTVIIPEVISDPEATVVKLDMPQNTSNEAQEFQETDSQATPPEQSSVQGDQSISSTPSFPDHGAVSTVTGTVSGTSSQSRSSSWSKSEHWLAEEGQRVQVGTVIKDRFELIELVGEGGMGMVFRAIDRRKIEAQDRNPYLAIKILNEQFKRHPESLKALQREARKAQDLAHPNIVTVFDFDREGSTVYMTMEFLDGESLKDIIKKNPNGLPVQQAISFIEGMCQGLSYAHAKGIVHSDFKPGNVFINRAGVIKIFDFGIARAAKTKMIGDTEGEKTTFDAATLGALTPAYASPEMFAGLDPDPRDDLFALACIAYELFSGKHPYNKERADQAREKGVQPKRLEQLNRLQWRGLAKGLIFERTARTASALHFLKDIKREKSKLPIIIGSSVLTIMVASLVFNKQLVYVWNQYNIFSLKNKINSILETEAEENVTNSLINLRNSKQLHKEIFYRNDIKPVIINAFSKRAKKNIDYDRKKYNFPKAIKLLTDAKDLYADDEESVNEINKIIDEYKSEQSKLISQLRERFEKLISEGKILPVRNQENVFNVMDSVALIDPGDPLLTDSRLVDAYVREANSNLEKNDLDRAREFIKTGLDVADANPQLIELKDKLTVRMRDKDVKLELSRIETEIGNRLKSIQSIQDLMNMGDGLRKLKELQVEHVLLAKAAKIGLTMLDRELKPIIDSQDWRAGDNVLKEVASLNLLSREAMQSRYDQLAAAKEKVEGAVEALFDKANRAIADGKPDGAISSISELKKSVPDDVRLQRLIAKLVQAYIQLARTAKDNYRWDAARTTLDLALKQDIDETMKASLLKEKEEIAVAEEGYRQQVKVEEKQRGEQEEIQKEKRRKDEILALHNQFESELKTFQPTDKSVYKALAILDTIEIKNAGDPFVGDGRKKIEELFLKECESLREGGSFEQAIKCLQIGLKALPDSKLLVKGISEYQQKRDIAKTQEQAAKLANLFDEVDKLIGSALLTKEWEAKLQKILADISSLLANSQDARLQDAKRKISTLYLHQAQKYRGEQQFTKANESLDKGDRFEKGSEVIAKERQLVVEDEKTFKEKAVGQQKLAEIEGLKQSLRTYAQANEIDQARDTLSRLKTKLAADDPFVVKEAPQVIATAYLRLAEKKAGAKDNRDNLYAAVELAKSGLQLDAKSMALFKAVESYNKAIAKLEKSPPPAEPTQVKPPAPEPAQVKPPEPAQIKPQPPEPAQVKPQQPEQKQPPPVTAGSGKPCSASLAGLGASVRAVCYDMVPDQNKNPSIGPYMVVVPAGGAIAKPFAIGKYEISFRDYDVFCKATGKNSPRTSEGSDAPAIRVSYQDAQSYAKWLTEKTGNTYRIPKDAEWTYAAEAGGKKPVTDYNCFLQQGSVVLKGNSLQNVNSGGANAWGGQNFIGNVQEYVDASSAVKVRGGSYKDSMSVCSITLVKNHSGAPDELTGFRLVREIKE